MSPIRIGDASIGKRREIDHGIHEYGNEQKRREQGPADAPVDRRPMSQHKLDVVQKILEAVEPENARHLETRQHEHHERRSVVVHKSQRELATLR